MGDIERSKRTIPTVGPRVFNPFTSLDVLRDHYNYRDSIDPQRLIHENPQTGVSNLRTPLTTQWQLFQTFLTKIVVSIHGACWGNGTSSARGAYSVFFGKRSPYNTSGILPETERQGSNAAVLYAAKRALEIIEDGVLEDLGGSAITEVILKTHSSYLFLGMVEDVKTWENNGYIDSDGKRVWNRFLIGKLQHLIEEAQRGKRFRTRFWLVPAEDNQEAVPSAEEALQRSRDGDEEDDEVPTEDELAFGECLEYWRGDAPKDQDAKVLARRLNFRLHDETVGRDTDADAAREIEAVLRRLVITGEDRSQNFECLFGTDWVELGLLWAKTRFEVLKEVGRGSKNPFSEIYDADAPFYRPRISSAAEEQLLGMSQAKK